MFKWLSTTPHSSIEITQKEVKTKVHVMHLSVQNTSTPMTFLTHSTCLCTYMTGITCGQDSPVNSHLGSRKNAVRKEGRVCWRCWNGDASILSPEDFIEETELVWGSIEVIQRSKASPFALVEHEHRLQGSSDSQGNWVSVRKTRPIRATKSCQTEALIPSTCVTSLVKYGN